MSYNDLNGDSHEVDGVKRGILLLVIAVLLAVAFFLSSCTVGYATDGTTKTFVGAMGGKGAAKSKQIAMNWDNEKSFNDAAMVALVAVPAVQAIKVAQSADHLSAIENTNAAKATINASNNAAAVETAKIGAETTKAITIPK